MGLRTKRRLLIAVVVIANCAPWLVYRWIGSPYEGPDWGNFVFEESVGDFPFHLQLHVRRRWEILAIFPHYLSVFHGLAIAQLLLFSVWTAFGQKAFLWRFFYLAAIAVLLTRMHLTDSESDRFAWMVAKSHTFYFLLALGVWASACLLLFRTAGLRLEPKESSTQRRPLTLAYLLWSVFAVCFLLAHARRLMTPIDWQWIWWKLELHLKTGLTAATMAFACVWLALGTRVWPVRLGVWIGTIMVMAIWDVGRWKIGLRLNPASYIPHAVYFALISLWIVGTLCALRQCGYQLQWHGWRWRKRPESGPLVL